MTVPVCRPEQPFIWSKDITMTSGCFGVAIFEVFDPVELSLCAELIANPNPLIPKSLDGLKYLVVKQIREAALWWRDDLVRLD